MAAPQPAPPQGPLAVFLVNQGVASSAALNTVSTLIGAVGAVGGVVSAAVAVISFVKDFLSSSGPSMQDLLDAINSAINDVKMVDQHLDAVDILNRNQAISDVLFSPTGVYQYFSGLADAVADPKTDGQTLIRSCSGALDFFGSSIPGIVWNYVYDWGVYWTDAGLYTSTNWSLNINTDDGGGIIDSYDPGPVDVGYGPQSPQLNADGTTVFVYSYCLPAYLEAVSIFISVGLALDPQFTTSPSWNPYLQATAALLTDKHNLIQAGITLLSPPFWTTANITQLSNQDPPGAVGIRTLYTDVATIEKVSPVVYLTYGAIIEYGAVEKYSGYSAIESNYIVLVDDKSASSDSGPFNKLQLRVLKKGKDVYMGVGLLNTWTTINVLLQLAGSPLLARPNYADWSFRRDIFPTTQIAASNGGWSSRSVAQFIDTTLPRDTPQVTTAYSFRALLNPIPTAPPPSDALVTLNTVNISQ